MGTLIVAADGEGWELLSWKTKRMEIVRICSECKKFFLFSIGFPVDLVAKRCWRYECVRASFVFAYLLSCWLFVKQIHAVNCQPKCQMQTDKTQQPNKTKQYKTKQNKTNVQWSQANWKETFLMKNSKNIKILRHRSRFDKLLLQQRSSVGPLGPRRLLV